MKYYKKNIEVFEFEEEYKGFFIEIHEEEEKIEYYIGHKEYGIKEMMFGIPKDPMQNQMDLNYRMICASADAYTRYYKEKFMDEV